MADLPNFVKMAYFWLILIGKMAFFDARDLATLISAIFIWSLCQVSTGDKCQLHH